MNSAKKNIVPYACTVYRDFTVQLSSRRKYRPRVPIKIDFFSLSSAAGNFLLLRKLSLTHGEEKKTINLGIRRVSHAIEGLLKRERERRGGEKSASFLPSFFLLPLLHARKKVYPSQTEPAFIFSPLPSFFYFYLF